MAFVGKDLRQTCGKMVYSHLHEIRIAASVVLRFSPACTAWRPVSPCRRA